MERARPSRWRAASLRGARATEPWVRRVLDQLLPRCCLLCGMDSGGARLCRPCDGDLPHILSGCSHCGLPERVPGETRCSSCMNDPPAWDSASAALRYEYPVDRLVRRFKFHGNFACGRVLAEALEQAAGRFAGGRPDFLVPVPLHFTRHLRRGYNQSEFLADHLGRCLGLEVHRKLLRRVRHTAAQSGLQRPERQRNLRGAFRCEHPVPQAHVGLVDDVLTTGATLDECARTLKSAGASKVSIWVAARVPAGKRP